MTVRAAVETAIDEALLSGTYDAARQQIKRAIGPLLDAAEPRWIPVSEKLPEEGQPILARWPNGAVDLIGWQLGHDIAWWCPLPPLPEPPR